MSTEMQQIRAAVAAEFDDVNRLIIDQLHSDIPLVENIGHYIVDAGGKRLRPLLVLLAGGACGEISKDHIKLAAVIEFIHTATLLHDDVVDISSLRRGKPTANATWGNAPSVLVGDFLYTRAFQILVDIGHMPLMQLMADTTNEIAEGEVLQLTRAGNPDTSEQDYLEVIKRKTAVLFAAASAGAAMLSDADQAAVDRHYQYGMNLGIAFQIIDDVLDYEGDPEVMGKNVGDDLAEGKPTLPLIYTKQHGTTEQQQLIQQSITYKTNEHINEVIAATQSSGAINYCRQRAAEFSRDALSSLDHLADGLHKQASTKLCDIALSRQA